MVPLGFQERPRVSALRFPIPPSTRSCECSRPLNHTSAGLRPDATIAPLVRTNKNPRLGRYIHLLLCPICGGQVDLEESEIVCSTCSAAFSVRNGVPNLLYQDSTDSNEAEVTDRIKHFYEENPFPDYEGFEDLAGLLEKAREGVFARLLDEQIPFGSRVLECGCGTGQLTNFLGIAHRTVIGTDLSLASLALAEAFRERHSLENVYFLQMNLFRPVFSADAFDFVICNGVLHHTGDPKRGFQKLAGLVRPGGYLLVGLYHRYGRLATDLRRLLFRLFGKQLSFLDPRFRRQDLGQTRWSAWFADQYQNPHESKHTIAAVLKWIEDSGLTFVRSIPDTYLLEPFSEEERLFCPRPVASRPELAIRELLLTFSPDVEGGFFSIIARKQL